MRGLANVNTSTRMKQLLVLIILILIGILFALRADSRQNQEGKVKTDQQIPRESRV